MRPSRQSGDQVLIRHVYLGRVLHARPVTVVAADERGIALWTAPGTRCIYPHVRDRAGRLLHYADWTLHEHVWYGSGALMCTPFAAAHSIVHFWRQDGRFSGWYVNLQDPLRATAAGFDTADHLLDVWVPTDGSWRWKDEDHVERALELGMLSPDQVAEIRTEGERVLAAWPFPTGWEDWRPDPTWPVPELPEDWDVR